MTQEHEMPAGAETGGGTITEHTFPAPSLAEFVTAIRERGWSWGNIASCTYRHNDPSRPIPWQTLRALVGNQR